MTTITSPFKFLDAYEKEDKDIFFGREKETNLLYDTVFKTRLALIYGVTGVGKTSLIQCGLANRFQDSQWMALSIRKGENYLQSILNEVQSKIAEAETEEFEMDDWGFGEDELEEVETVSNDEGGFEEETDPVAALEQLYQLYFKPIYLIFDQFEEIFTIGTYEERVEFFNFLLRLNQKMPQVKVLISFREEYLAHMSDFETIVPYLFDHRLRIEKMRGAKLKEVIEGTLNATQIKFEEEVPEQIIQKLTPDRREGVELSYLQVYLDKLFRKGQEKQNIDIPTFQSDLIEEVGELQSLMKDFLQERVEEITPQNQKSDEIWEVLKAFITDEGTKKPLHKTDLFHLLNPLKTKNK